MEERKNCRNCGAPLDKHGDCEYCGTKSPREFSSRIKLTADGITFIADERAIVSTVTKHMGT